jgi:hypothetical protein
MELDEITRALIITSLHIDFVLSILMI